MKEDLMIMGLPLETLIIVGGLFILSVCLPTIIALILRWKEKNNE